jgi:hypothetical protein
MLQKMQEYLDVDNEEVFIMSSLLVICSANTVLVPFSVFVKRNIKQTYIL